MSTTVNVSGISSQTNEKEVRDFFSFCGKIESLNTKEGGEATVTFAKESAARTALLLDNTQLGPAQVHVTSAGGSTDTASKSSDETYTGDDVAQEDKPRARIFAEYLAHGYAISDKVIERGLALDQQHGISTRFTTALQNFDQKFKATDKAKAVDQQYQVTAKATAGFNGLYSYFEKAASTPSGQKIRQFYQVGNKQVMDVHNEARHLANLKTSKNNSATPVAEGSDRTTCKCGSDTGKCPCAPGTCACSNCAKNPEAPSSAGVEKMGTEKVEGTDKD